MEYDRPLGHNICVLVLTIRIPHECEGGIEKIRAEDRRLASRDLTSYDKRWSRGTDFPYLSSHEYWICFHDIPEAHDICFREKHSSKNELFVFYWSHVCAHVIRRLITLQ